MNLRILAVDVGNTCTDLGLFENHVLLSDQYFPSALKQIETLISLVETWHRERPLDAVILASVVPALADLLVSRLDALTGRKSIHVADMKTRLLPLRVDYPETVGVDRVVNCYAAKMLYGAPAVVVSMGTATTFEALSAEGEYLGGAIAPGVNISLEALTHRTALLPPVVFGRPERLIAVHTIGHMQSGIYYGTLSLIEGMVRRFKAALGEEAKVIGTGGLSAAIAGEGIFDIHDPYLTLKGLERIACDLAG